MRTLIRFVLWTWFLAALVVGRLGLLRTLPTPALPGLLLGLTAVALAVCFGVPAVRAWQQTVDLRLLILVHVSRLIGYVFLILYRQDRLPYSLGMQGGWGEITVAALALLVVVVPMRATLRRHACIIWNTIGLINILLITATVVRLSFSQPWRLWTLQLLPCSMLPTFLMPLIIATHVIIYRRLRSPDEPADVHPADQPATL
jgi:hypothetical protein